MDTKKKKRGRPPEQKVFETTGITYEGAINYALDKDMQSELDDTLAHKSEGELTDDERKYLKRKREKKSYTLNVRFTESKMQDILLKCEQYGYKNKTEYIRDCVRVRVNLTPDSGGLAEVNKAMKRIGSNINQIAVRLHSIIRAKRLNVRGQSCGKYRTRYAPNTAYLLLSRKVKGYPTLSVICRSRASCGKISSVRRSQRLHFTVRTLRIFCRDVLSAVSSMFINCRTKSS